MMNDYSPEAMQRRYRNVFSSAEGRLVLGDILTLGHFGVPLETNNPAMVAEFNFAMIIARMSGAFDPFYTQIGIPVREEN